MRRLINVPGITFVIFLLWKVVLLLFVAQPVPSNDAFFYDGPVVNYLLHGKYCNPSIAPVLPISGNEVFSAYPPLYQAVLLGWMKCFGTTVLAAMWLHVVLLGVFALAVLRIFQQLQVSAIAVNLAGLFLFGITFHDRPDTLAHVLGALAILATVRGMFWPGSLFLLLAFCTSLQIGGIYALWISALVMAGLWLGKARFPWAPVGMFFIALFGLVGLVKFGHPHLWEGFREHVKVTPSFTGLRLPRADDVLKVVRTAPGILVVIAGLLALLKRSGLRELLERSSQMLVAGCGALAAAAVVGGCLLILTPNAIHIAGYLQPVVIGCFLGATKIECERSRLTRLMPILFVAAALLVSVRAIGITTWGWLCARDVDYARTIKQLNHELDSVPSGSTVFISSAYLYEAAGRTNLTWLHSDWPNHAATHDGGLNAIEELKPTRLILTQFDYYRRYEPVIGLLRRYPEAPQVRVENLARIPPPDALPGMRKVVQHISWAPVIVEFSWPQTRESK